MTEKKVWIKIHDDSRRIAAVCDSELIGKTFEEGKLQLKVNEHFYKGKECDELKAIKILNNAKMDDACFNLVGDMAVELGVKIGVIDKTHVIRIQGIPHALALL
jgi:uncharacterized protein